MSIWEIIWGALPGIIIFGAIALAIIWKVFSLLWNGTGTDVKPVIRYGEHDHYDDH